MCGFYAKRSFQKPKPKPKVIQIDGVIGTLAMRGVTILGAGLSGLTAAINLAKEGFKVDVYGKNEDVGMRFHGDLQGLENSSGKKDVDRSYLSHFSLTKAKYKWIFHFMKLQTF